MEKRCSCRCQIVVTQYTTIDNTEHITAKRLKILTKSNLLVLEHQIVSLSGFNTRDEVSIRRDYYCNFGSLLQYVNILVIFIYHHQINITSIIYTIILISQHAFANSHSPPTKTPQLVNQMLHIVYGLLYMRPAPVI